MTTTPKQITEASNYWSNFRKLPIGNAEMIMHLATFSNELQNNQMAELEKRIDELIILENTKKNEVLSYDATIECSASIKALLKVKNIVLSIQRKP